MTVGALLTTGRAEEMRAAASFGWSPSPEACSEVPVDGSAGAAGASPVVDDAAFVAAAFFAAAFLAAGFSSPSSPVFLAAAFLRVGFDSSSGCCSRIRPSRSARARTRSACASMTDDEMPFTPIPSLPHRSINS